MTITIREVAKEAGVSIATVSKVINGSPTISEATTERVNEVMKRLNYYPNLRARNFAKKSSNNIVFVCNLKKNMAFYNPHLFEIISGVQNYLMNKGYTLTLFNVDEDASYEQLQRFIGQKSADAIMLHVSVLTKELEKVVNHFDIPHIMIGEPPIESKLSWVDINNKLCGEKAAAHMLNCGYTRIIYIGGEENDTISKQRLDGVRKILKRRNLPCYEYFTKIVVSSKEEGRILMRKALQEHKVDGVICGDSLLALGALKELERLNVKIGEEIGVMGFDNYPYSELSEPSMTIVDANLYELGVKSGKLILAKLKNKDTSKEVYLEDIDIITRSSTKKRI